MQQQVCLQYGEPSIHWPADHRLPACTGILTLHTNNHGLRMSLFAVPHRLVGKLRHWLPPLGSQ